MYQSDFSKTYEPKSNEWLHRQSIFEQNLKHIIHHNMAYFGNEEGGSFFLGINEFLDLESNELPLGGYDKSRHEMWQQQPPIKSEEGGAAVLEIELKKEDFTIQSIDRKLLVDNDYKMDIPFEILEVNELPSEVDWRKPQGPKKDTNTMTPVKNQKMCGSCWAFASIEALESHIANKTGTLYTLSPQQLVSCTPNPRQCGGTGGCEGATAELAFSYVAEHGIVQDKTFPYDSVDEACSWDDKTTSSFLRREEEGKNSKKNFVHDAVASIQGYANIPTNDYKVMMNAVYHGPVVIAVAATPWSFYRGGIYKTDLSKGGVFTDLNHAVVIVGYGTDENTGTPYWIVRNSWGTGWGEDGYIRLLRENPNNVESSTDDDDNDNTFCGFDTTPLDGSACAVDKDGHKLIPKSVKVCGTSGLLFEGVIPVGGYKL